MSELVLRSNSQVLNILRNLAVSTKAELFDAIKVNPRAGVVCVCVC